MPDRRLQVFHTVARLLSFTKAAEALQMTQPAVTFQVRQLEEQFGTRLFDRSHNRIALTEAGTLTYQYSTRIFDLYAEMESAVRELTDEGGDMLILGASDTVAEYMLPDLLGGFRARFPELKLRLKVAHTEAIVSMVENNAVDLGIVEDLVAQKGLEVEPCCHDRLVAAIPAEHPLARQQALRPSMLLEHPLILSGEDSSCQRALWDYLKAAGIDPGELHVAMELHSLEAVKGAVGAGIGMAVVPRAALQKELQVGSLVAVELDPPLDRGYSFVYQRLRLQHETVEELLGFLRQCCLQRR